MTENSQLCPGSLFHTWCNVQEATLIPKKYLKSVYLIALFDECAITCGKKKKKRAGTCAAFHL